MALQAESTSSKDEQLIHLDEDIPFAANGEDTIRRSQRLRGSAPAFDGLHTPRRRTLNGGRSEEDLGGNADGEEAEVASVQSSRTKASSKSMSIASSSRSEVLRRRLAVELQAKKELNEIEQEKEELLRELLQKRAQRQADIVEATLMLEQAKIDEECGEDDNLSQHLGNILPKSNKENVGAWMDGEREEQGAVAIATAQPSTPTTEETSMEVTKIDKFLARQTIPKDLPYFGGDVTEWTMFSTQYWRSTKMLGLSDDENLMRLQKCLKGKARDAVLPILLLPENVAKVMETLELMFGRTDQIIKSMVEKVKSSPNPRESKPESLICFSNLIAHLVSTIKALKKTGHMTNPQLLEDLHLKLPQQLQYKWCKKVKKLEAEPTLEDMSDWIAEIAMTASLMPVQPNSNNEESKSTNVNKNNKHVLNIVEKSDTMCPQCSSHEHSLDSCKKFHALNSKERWDCVMKNKLCVCCLKKGHIGRKCPEKKVCGIDNCDKYHNQGLHRKSNERENDSAQGSSHVGHTWNGMRETLLRVLPVMLTGPKGTLRIYAMLDEGSTLTLVDNGVAEQLGLDGVEDPLCIHWTNDVSREEEHSRRVSVDISGDAVGSQCYKLQDVRTIANLSLPTHTVDMDALKRQCEYLSDVPYESVRKVKPMMLIGQDNIILSAARKFIRGPWASPVASLTPLGWVVHGKVPMKKRMDDVIMLHSCEGDQELNQLVKESFATESFGVKITAKCPRSKEDEVAVKIMEDTTVRVGERFQTGLLWRQEKMVLPNSRATAERRLQCVERRMDRDAPFAQTYCAKVQEFLDKGYARLMSEEEVAAKSPKTWYIPHFGVTNPNKPGKVRLVFDAAAKTQGVSLNSCIYKGPDLLNPLPAVLWRFRRHRVAAVGDIKEMFPQIIISPEDQDAQRFLWRGMDRKQPPKVYKMVRMIFGAASSPSSANYIKNINALEYKDEFPRVFKAITEDTYMDDHLDGGSSDDDLKEHLHNVIHVYLQAGFKICNWSCSSRAVLESIPEELRASGNVDLTESVTLPTERVLGLYWNAETDAFCFNFKCHKVDPAIVSGSKIPTKREVLKLLMSLFDPLGFLAHYLIKGKILFQQVWRSGLGWDDSLSENLVNVWKSWLAGLNEASQMKIPRSYHPELPSASTIELHTFVDASEEAFAAISYLRIEVGGQVAVSFVAAKTKVAPLKPLSIPRLELQAAILGVRLAGTIKEELQLDIRRSVFWSDSRTVLCWIRSDSRKYKQFVAHRIGEILESTNEAAWRWVPTEENVADEATRSNLSGSWGNGCRWLSGPDFLKLVEPKWPVEVLGFKEPEEEKKGEFLLLIDGAGAKTEFELLPSLSRFSNWQRLIRVTAWVRVLGKFWYDPNFKRKISVEDLLWAAKLWWRRVQQDCFPEEVKKLQHGIPLERSSKLWRLDSFLDDDGVMRLRGRTSEAVEMAMESVNPVILDRKHPYTQLLMMHYHCKAGHQGRETVVNNLRQKYIILGARSAVRKLVSSCRWCMMRKTKPVSPKMADLPPARVTSYGRAFMQTGMDFFGPVYVKIGRRKEKRYGVIFTCLAVRAVHLEVAANLTTGAAINAVRRFIDRRGIPADLYSDNGRNFRGAERELREAIEKLQKDEMTDYSTSRSFNWHFIPPSTPHMGGSWERLVRSVKSALYSTLTGAVSEDVLTTLLTEAEAVVNSRPLTHVPEDPTDGVCLTPNHFLIGPNNIIYPPGDFSSDGKRLRSQWKIVQRLADHFWTKWLKEYLPTLTRRTKWNRAVTPLKNGDLVIIADPSQPRMTWSRGVIVRVFPGKDGQVRVADVKTTCGVYRRPANKLCLIDVN